MTKKHPAVGCCGLDCGLCPRFYTEGKSKCPGCCGPDFLLLHPSCPVITCCVKKRNLEVCAECDVFPCAKFDSQGIETDSFITHKKILNNLNFIKSAGLNEFLRIQKERTALLNEMLDKYNEGRSKSFYCIACTLLSVANLKEAIKSTESAVRQIFPDDPGIKKKSEILKEYLNKMAIEENVELKLNNKKNDKAL